MRHGGCLVAVAVALVSTPANAQNVLGSSVINGRTVQIMSDFTWRYEVAKASECETVKYNIGFCGQNLGWRKVESKSANIVSMYTLNSRTYGLFLIEDIGSDDGISMESMKSAIVHNAAEGAGVTSSDVPVFENNTRIVGKLTGESISYAVKVDGVPFVFTTTVLLEKNRVTQISTYSLGNQLTDIMRSNHKVFLDSVRIN